MSEIHDQSYRRYRGERSARSSAWTVIALAGIRSLVRKRVFLGLLLAAWGPFFVGAVRSYIAANFPQTEAAIGLSARTFRQFLDWQSFFVFFVTIYVGAGLIANDRRSNALQIYLSKPLTRTEYIAGKLVILVVFLLLVTWVPALLLLLLQALFQGSFEFARANLFLIPAITVFSFLQVLLASCTMLALSSLSKSSRYAAVLYAGAVLFTDATFNVLRFITGNSGLSWISFPASLEQIGNLIFRLPPKYDTPWAVSLLAIIGLITLSISVLERRVRGVEIVT
jgi:ABC-2 type transport system permease protein